ncbi:hypothetical protein [Nocardiopsis halophila]|nr:hypothetical protein [Nocardiopsis halophila]
MAEEAEDLEGRVEEYAARLASARALTAAPTLIMSEEGNAYEYRDAY